MNPSLQGPLFTFRFHPFIFIIIPILKLFFMCLKESIESQLSRQQARLLIDSSAQQKVSEREGQRESRSMLLYALVSDGMWHGMNVDESHRRQRQERYSFCQTSFPSFVVASSR
jgi:hypothetical protein